jgi:acetyl-CoA carboxylase carboxyl transferase subunit beta
MGWFSREKAPKPQVGIVTPQSQMPDDTWSKCPRCSAILFTKELRRNFGVCLKCSYHFRLTAEQRIPLLVDKNSFVEADADMRPGDPLNFRDKVKYRDRIKKAEKSSTSKEAVRIGKALIQGKPVRLAVFDFSYMAGSMGSVVGEKLTRLIESGLDDRAPVIIVAASGGARMQEGVLSLMQMAKVTCALGRLSIEGIPYISVLTDPTTGGVAASFAMQGDVILAEPNALIGFAGPRVIQQTIRQQLPPEFQRAEFLLEHGIIDRIVQRGELHLAIATTLRNFGF